VESRNGNFPFHRWRGGCHCARDTGAAIQRTGFEIERVGRDLGVKLEVRLTQVPDAEAARRQRFLGSPTVRVNGRDVEPGAGQRTDYVYACRVYRTESGISGQPDERWLREAIAAASRDRSG
jgi:hypothetical protein